MPIKTMLLKVKESTGLWLTPQTVWSLSNMLLGLLGVLPTICFHFGLSAKRCYDSNTLLYFLLF